jgi:hypothetical protein
MAWSIGLQNRKVYQEPPVDDYSHALQYWLVALPAMSIKGDVIGHPLNSNIEMTDIFDK